MVEKRGIKKNFLIFLALIVFAGILLTEIGSSVTPGSSCYTVGGTGTYTCSNYLCPSVTAPTVTCTCTSGKWVCPACAIPCCTTNPTGGACSPTCQGTTNVDQRGKKTCTCSGGSWSCSCNCDFYAIVNSASYHITSCDTRSDHIGWCCEPYSTCALTKAAVTCGDSAEYTCGISVCPAGTKGTKCAAGYTCTSNHCCLTGYIWDSVTNQCKAACTETCATQCAAGGYNCGTKTLTVCGVSTSCNCGTCAGTLQCNSNVCGCAAGQCKSGTDCYIGGYTWCGGSSYTTCLSNGSISKLQTCSGTETKNEGCQYRTKTCTTGFGTTSGCQYPSTWTSKPINTICSTTAICSANTIVKNKKCDSSGNCVIGDTQACPSASCSENTSGSGTALSASTCSGGVCLTQGTTTCTLGYGCCSTSCCSSCSSSIDCAAGYSCNANKVCVKLCGNGIKDTDEACDNGASNGVVCTAPYGGSCKYCSSDCKTETTVQGEKCGDGIKNGNEVCDSGGNNGKEGACWTDCSRQTTYCGDGILTNPDDLGVKETCDDGNIVSNDGCSSTCIIEPPVCGDGKIWGGEVCDDGTNNGKAGYCWTNCLGQTTYCGDGILTNPDNLGVNEACDSGANNGKAGYCWTNCLGQTTYCGDGILTNPDNLGVNEACDSGANNGKAGYCWTNCLRQTKYCGDGIIDKPNDLGVNEVCDSAQEGCKTDCSGWNTDAYWAEVADGEKIASISVCKGKSYSLYTILKYSGLASTPVTIQIWNDLLFDAKIKEFSSQTDSYGNMKNTAWQITSDDLKGFGEGTKQLHFDVNQNGGSKIKTSENIALTVKGEDYCSSKLTCGDYNIESECNSDPAGVADATVNSYFESTGSNLKCGEGGINCKCEWTTENICEGAYESAGVGCGNGIEETGEQCDDGNTANGDGCSSTCTIEDEIQPPCIEGTTLCSDGTCSIRCPISDTENANCNNNGVCDTGEGCSCPDCNGKKDTCKSGLLCSLTDSHCCNSNSDNICDPYCSKTDPDCKTRRFVGTCHIKSEIKTNCDETNRIRTINLITSWTGGEGAAKQKCMNLNGRTISTPCPEQIQLSFFDYYELAITLIVIALIYVSLIFRRKFGKKKRF